MPSTDRVTPGPLTRTRTRDPLTSMNAAAAISPIEQTKVKDAIEAILADLGPLTDEDIFAAYVDRGYPRRTATRIRTARSEMTKLDTPTRIRAAHLPDVKLPSGHFAQRWELLPADDERVAA